MTRSYKARDAQGGLASPLLARDCGTVIAGDGSL